VLDRLDKKKHIRRTNKRRDIELVAPLAVSQISNEQNNKVSQISNKVSQISNDEAQNNRNLSLYKKYNTKDINNITLTTTDVSYKRVMESWNSFAERTGRPRIITLSEKRKRAIRARYSQIWPRIDEIYEAIEASRFLMGEKKDWGGVTFDFVWVRDDAWLKVLEGAYRRDRHVSKPEKFVATPPRRQESEEELLRSIEGL